MKQASSLHKVRAPWLHSNRKACRGHGVARQSKDASSSLFFLSLLSPQCHHRILTTMTSSTAHYLLKTSPQHNTHLRIGFPKFGSNRTDTNHSKGKTLVAPDQKNKRSKQWCVARVYIQWKGYSEDRVQTHNYCQTLLQKQEESREIYSHFPLPRSPLLAGASRSSNPAEAVGQRHVGDGGVVNVAGRMTKAGGEWHDNMAHVTEPSELLMALGWEEIKGRCIKIKNKPIFYKSVFLF